MLYLNVELVKHVTMKFQIALHDVIIFQIYLISRKVKSSRDDDSFMTSKFFRHKTDALREA